MSADFTSPGGTPIAWDGPQTPAVRRALATAGLTRSTQITGTPIRSYRTVKPRDTAFIEVHLPRDCASRPEPP